jgi:transposase
MLKAQRNGTGGRGAKRAIGERSSAAGRSARGGAQDPELVERPKRRRFTAQYKLRILEEADACMKSGEIGALLRREGLYSSHLTDWRKQRDEGALARLGRRRGRKKADPLVAELAKARKVIEVQGKVSALLGELLEPRGAKPGESSE